MNSLASGSKQLASSVLSTCFVSSISIFLRGLDGIDDDGGNNCSYGVGILLSVGKDLKRILGEIGECESVVSQGREDFLFNDR